MDIDNMWCRQDGATCHTSNETMNLLQTKFPGRKISRNSAAILQQILVAFCVSTGLKLLYVFVHYFIKYNITRILCLTYKALIFSIVDIVYFGCPD